MTDKSDKIVSWMPRWIKYKLVPTVVPMIKTKIPTLIRKTFKRKLIMAISTPKSFFRALAASLAGPVGRPGEPGD
jgi:hypothetical protein